MTTHWLVRIVEQAGLVGDRALGIAADTPARDAWAALALQLGLSEEELAGEVARFFRLEVADLAGADSEAAQLVPEKFARRHLVFPVGMRGRTLMVATSDPTDVNAEGAVAFTSGRVIVFQVAPPEAIARAIDAGYPPEPQGGPEPEMDALLDGIDRDGIEAVKLIETRGPESVTEKETEATPVIRLSNLILRDGIQAGASDIHVEPSGAGGLVRFRVDGVMRPHMQLPAPAMNRVISRIKILSRLDIADRIRPQDGKARVGVGGKVYDLRISTIPAGGSEKCVVRILDPGQTFSLDDLSLPEPEVTRFRRLLQFRDGIVVMTGPTGSGKTTTLYGALRELADGRVNIMTVEDPIEYQLDAVTQTQVELKQGVTFARALRAILRQDPDIILVGEIRDREAAEVAAQAAMTGHLVLTTVHANDAVSTVARLADLGLPYGTIAVTLRGAIAQRLLRRACPTCREPVEGDLTLEETRLAERFGVVPVVRATGCLTCGLTGYRGRLPAVEVLTVTPVMQQAIESRKGHQTLRRAATQAGMRPLNEVALDWARQGETTLVEVERLLGQMIDLEQDESLQGPPRILIVDDDPSARLLMRTLLSKEGYQITEAEDGESALDILFADPSYALGILDLTLPGMQGREVLHRIRGSVDTAALPILVRTGSGSPHAEAELLELGADDYVSKETDSNRFLARVRAVLRRAVI